MVRVKFYCVNLANRKDRREKATQLFKRLGLKVEFWTVDPHPEGGRYGCFESHLQVWLHSRADITVVMEDDLEFRGSKDEFWALLKEGWSLSQDYDLVNLGRIPVALGQRVGPNFVEGRFVALSCYLGRTKTLRSLAERVAPYYGMHIDTVLSFCSRQVALDRDWFYQSFTDSNNSWTDNIPIVSLFQIDRHLRTTLQRDPLVLTRLPGWLWSGLTRFLMGLRVAQRVLPESFFRKTIELRDRRILVNERFD